MMMMLLLLVVFLDASTLLPLIVTIIFPRIKTIMSQDNATKTLKARPQPKALPHGALEQVLENVYMVTGTIEMTMMGCLKMSFSRNMVVVRQSKDNGSKHDLILVNTVRLDEEGLNALDQLGQVQHILRLAGHHGMDDPFYKERYPEATVWALAETSYFTGFDSRSPEVYFQADRTITSETKLPFLDKASLIVIPSKPPQDGILVLERSEGKVFVTGDSLQNMDVCDPYFNFLGRICMRMMGFIAPYQVGPAWSQVCQVQPQEMQALLEHKFDHVLPGHGRPVLGQAWKKYEPSIRSMKEPKEK